MHVEQAPCVRRRLRHTHHGRAGQQPVIRRQLAVLEITFPVAGVTKPFLKTRRQGGARVERRRRARTAGVFPLRFRRQPVGPSLFRGKPDAELHRVIPAHARDGFIRRAPVAAIGRLELPVLAERHFCRAQLERRAERHAVRRPLVPIRIVAFGRMLGHPIIRRRPILAHEKSARLDAHEFHTERVHLVRAAVAADTDEKCQGQQMSYFHRFVPGCYQLFVGLEPGFTGFAQELCRAGAAESAPAPARGTGGTARPCNRRRCLAATGRT